jgi:hypothetical protein
MQKSSQPQCLFEGPWVFMDYLKIDKKYDKLLPPERDTKTIQKKFSLVPFYSNTIYFFQSSKNRCQMGISTIIMFYCLVIPLMFALERIKRAL